MFQNPAHKHISAYSIAFLLVLMLGSCSSPKQNPSNASNAQSDIEFDSIEKARIDTIVFKIHEAIREAGQPQKIPYTVYDPTDTIYFWTLPDKSARISLELNLPTGINWPTFYVHNGDLVYVRYRQVFQDSTMSSASETMAYLRDNKIIFCEERGKILGPEEYPGFIKQLPFQHSTRSPAEITDDYHDYWLLILDQMNQYKLKPEYLH